MIERIYMDLSAIHLDEWQRLNVKRNIGQIKHFRQVQ